jgi:hypothetical protein
MKIEIELDIKKIVREEICKYVRDNLVITDAVTAMATAMDKIWSEDATATPAMTDSVEVTLTTTEAPVSAGVAYEYAPKLGRRRNKTEIAMHDKELELGRILTPEEKGQIDANFEIDDEKQAKAKEATKKKAHIDEIAAEGMAAAAKELAEEADAVTSSDGIDSLPESILDAAESFDTILTLTSIEEDTNADEVMPGEEEEATIPNTEEVSIPDSLFK